MKGTFMKFAVKTIMIAAALVMLFSPVQAAELESGFMGTKWSAPATELKGFARVGGKEKLSYYVHPQQVYTFFGREVPAEVVYGFFEERFFSVYVDIVEIDLFFQVKSYIQRKYGVPNKTSRDTRGDLTTYIWRLKQTQIKFKHYETSGKMKIAFYYLPIAKQANAEMEKNLEAEPPPIIYPVDPFNKSESPNWPRVEFMRF
jgi:hypothetical protein